MATHNELGKFGEKLGIEHLTTIDFTILYVNWKYSYYEIDIIAHKQNVLHFIEVKTRRSQRYGQPEESVDSKKMSRLMNAAEEFLYQFPDWKRIQYDVLSVYIDHNNQVEFYLIEDVFL